MSQENIEIVNALFPPPGTDFARLIRDDESFARMSAVLGPLITEDFQSLMAFPGQNRTYGGLDGYRKNWLDWLEPWATYRTTMEELIDAGECVVVFLRDHGRRKDMDLEIELIGATTFRFRSGKLAQIEDYADRAQALAAVGLRE